MLFYSLPLEGMGFIHLSAWPGGDPRTLAPGGILEPIPGTKHLPS